VCFQDCPDCGTRNLPVTLSPVDEVAGAVADAVRREILLLLRDEPLSAGQIAGRFPISRPAISRHLRVLREAGLVRDTVDGRRRVYTLVTEPLDELAGWLSRLTRPSGWAHRLDALETEVHRTRREREREQTTGREREQTTHRKQQRDHEQTTQRQRAQEQTDHRERERTTGREREQTTRREHQRDHEHTARHDHHTHRETARARHRPAA
jgi:DNA-binding transcriptional ArsR family regulator